MTTPILGKKPNLRKVGLSNNKLGNVPVFQWGVNGAQSAHFGKSKKKIDFSNEITTPKVVKVPNFRKFGLSK